MGLNGSGFSPLPFASRSRATEGYAPGRCHRTNNEGILRGSDQLGASAADASIATKPMSRSDAFSLTLVYLYGISNRCMVLVAVSNIHSSRP
jgi:hypothetical protein